MTATSIAQTTSEVYDILTGLTPEDRARVLTAIVALFGDAPLKVSKASADDSSGGDASELPRLGVKAKRWMRQEGVTIAELTEVFHMDDTGTVKVIATEIPGATKKDKTANVYLISGVRSLLASDEPSIDNQAAVDYCKHVGCYDRNNHTANRTALGNKIIGSVANGFVLPAPGLKAAAAAIKLSAKPVA